MPIGVAVWPFAVPNVASTRAVGGREAREAEGRPAREVRGAADDHAGALEDERLAGVVAAADAGERDAAGAEAADHAPAVSMRATSMRRFGGDRVDRLAGGVRVGAVQPDRVEVRVRMATRPTGAPVPMMPNAPALNGRRRWPPVAVKRCTQAALPAATLASGPFVEATT